MTQPEAIQVTRLRQPKHWLAAWFCLTLAACATTPGPGPSVRVVDKIPTPPTPEHQADIETWRKARVDRLTAPEGWLSLVGLHWLTEGEQTAGSDADNAIRLASGPARLGAFKYENNQVWFRADRGPQVFVKYAARMEQDSQGRVWHLLSDDSQAKPTVIRSEPITVLLILRGGKPALRVKDPNASTRTGFQGIDYFPIDADFKVQARFVPHSEPTYFDIQTVLGTIDRMQTPGVLYFTISGQEYSIQPVLEEGSADWFFIFADRTNGRETYGPGRFLYAPPAVDGVTTIDFNRAYNPPCAFSAYSTCPLPPPENRLNLRVTAGEKKYRGPAGRDGVDVR